MPYGGGARSLANEKEREMAKKELGSPSRGPIRMTPLAYLYRQGQSRGPGSSPLGRVAPSAWILLAAGLAIAWLIITNIIRAISTDTYEGVLA